MKQTFKRSLALALPFVVAMTLISSAYAASSVIKDPAGDSTAPAPYTDVVHARVIEQQGKESLVFMMQLAGPIPEQPSALLWVFHVDTNPATSPGGLYNEYVVRVRWLNGVLVGEVVDRTIAPPVVTPVPFSIDGPTVRVFAGLALLGNPSSFGWNAATRLGPPPALYVDFAPDGTALGGSGLATWTQ